VTSPAQVVLVILDGWGCGPEAGNAIHAARTPNIDKLRQKYPAALLAASGSQVGLPEGQMGNSEVGHLNIGAGRVVYQDLTRISKDIVEGGFFVNPALIAAMDAAASSGGALHLLGLLSDGGVHSHLDHIEALLRMARDRGAEQVFVHPLLDGRDVPPQSAQEYIYWLEQACREIGVGSIATIGGRYYGMDRDKRWQRTELAYRALVFGEGLRSESAAKAVEAAYADGVTDEFVLPTVINPRGAIKSGDSVIAFNFRPDRMRQLTRALTDEDFPWFSRKEGLKVHYLCMTQYDETITAPVAYPPETLENTLGQVISALGLRQLRIAETEKYAHVTYFFNGGEEKPMPGEERLLIPSPKVETYDLQPEMSSEPVTAAVCSNIASQDFSLVVLNYANPDMVGHTGNFAAAVQACEAVDRCVGRVWAATEAAGGAMLLFSDHGNADLMIDALGKPHTAHTANPVPLVLAWPGVEAISDGALCDIAPTVLDLLGIAQPREMTGKSLIIKE
jgi:2,3-bisphosphoglycerate-independent phosphoglycerate mutase